jgi:uncharacterized protein
MSLRRTVRWRSLEVTGLEHLQVEEREATIAIESILISERDDKFGVRYEMTLAPDWTFRTVTIHPVGSDTFTLSSDGEGNWIANGREVLELHGCIDVDMSGTPFTNTLPIRRNRWAVEEPQRFNMAWIPLDTLAPFKDGQIYTWLGGDRYRYQAADGSFEAILTVDADGIIVHYEGLFERLD